MYITRLWILLALLIALCTVDLLPASQTIRAAVDQQPLALASLLLGRGTAAQAHSDHAMKGSGDATAAVAAFAGVATTEVQYHKTVKTAYDMTAPLKLYVARSFLYALDPRTNTIIQAGPAPRSAGEPPQAYLEQSLFTPEQLEAKARAFIQARLDVPLDTLTANHATKVSTPVVSDKPGSAQIQTREATYYFFRWEDRTKMLEGAAPFVTIGFSAGGDFLSYTNTIALAQQSATGGASINLTGTYIYANGGNYYTWGGPSQSRYFVSNAGYCYISNLNWCNPKNMEWTRSTTSSSDVNYAVWNNIDSAQYGTIEAFIPCPGTTTHSAKYQITYNNWSQATRTISQLAYCNQWVYLATLYSIQATRLGDATGDSAQIGFDEIRIIY